MNKVWRKPPFCDSGRRKSDLVACRNVWIELYIMVQKDLLAIEHIMVVQVFVFLFRLIESKTRCE